MKLDGELSKLRNFTVVKLDTLMENQRYKYKGCMINKRNQEKVSLRTER